MLTLKKRSCGAEAAITKLQQNNRNTIFSLIGSEEVALRAPAVSLHQNECGSAAGK
jgi:hypothetical protein